MKVTPPLLLTAFLMGVPSASQAQTPADASGALLRGCACRPVDDGALAQMRGGFDDGLGLVASIGLERLTLVNGVVVSTANLQISDLSRISAGQIQQLQSTLAAVGLANGAGNLNGVLQGASPGTTVIQNAQDNQTIRNSTVLSISTNSQQFLKASNLQTTLQDALTQALQGHR